jgi:hypothetical protein
MVKYLPCDDETYNWFENDRKNFENRLGFRIKKTKYTKFKVLPMLKRIKFKEYKNAIKKAIK